MLFRSLTGYLTSIAVDAGGNPHIVYFDGTRDDLNYAYFDGAEWHISVIDGEVSGKADNTFTTLIIDPAGNLHVAYTDAINGDLKYAHSSSGAVWEIEPVDTAGEVGAYPAMALDGLNQPYISYGKTVDTISGLYVAFFDEDSVWTRRELDTTGEVYFTSVAVASDGEIHIGYLIGSFGVASLRYMTGSDFIWLRDTVAGPGSLGSFCSIDLGAGETPSIAYISTAGDDRLNLATRVGDNWTTETVDEASVGLTGLFCSLLFDSSNNPRIGFQSIQPGTSGWQYLARYASRANGSWTVETADSVGVVGFYLDLAIDGSGRPHLSYQDLQHADLKYAIKR